MVVGAGRTRGVGGLSHRAVVGAPSPVVSGEDLRGSLSDVVSNWRCLCLAG